MGGPLCGGCCSTRGGDGPPPAIRTRRSTPAARTGAAPAAPRNGATAIASSGRMKAEPTFVAAYWWRVHPGKEDQFRAAWRRGTELIREKYGSLGSRLHRDRKRVV